MATRSAHRDAKPTSSLIISSVPGEETTIPASFDDAQPTVQPTANTGQNRRQRRMAGKQQPTSAKIPVAGRQSMAVNPRQYTVRRRGGR